MRGRSVGSWSVSPTASFRAVHAPSLICEDLLHYLVRELDAVEPSERGRSIGGQPAAAELYRCPLTAVIVVDAGEPLETLLGILPRDGERKESNCGLESWTRLRAG